MSVDQKNIEFIKKWHQAFEQNSFDAFCELLHEDIVLISPAYYEAKKGKPLVQQILNLVWIQFSGYQVTDTWNRENEILFEFSVSVDDFQLQGIDRIRLTPDGRIAELKVFLRPLKGLIYLSEKVRAAT